MINFCKKSFHTLFNTAPTGLSPPGEDSSAIHHRITPLPVTDYAAGLNFLSKIPKSNHVIMSPSRPLKSEPGLKVVNSADIDRLASCTESLGFESCTERSVNNVLDNSEKSRADGQSRKFDKKNRGGKNKSFPPPLSTFNGNGRPTFFLRPVRNHGRLELTEVKINRPDTLCASREDGRLRLHLVEPDHKDDYVITSTDVVGEISSKDKKGLNFPTSSGGGEDCRLLHEIVNKQQQHNMHGWGPECVIIR